MNPFLRFNPPQEPDALYTGVSQEDSDLVYEMGNKWIHSIHIWGGTWLQNLVPT